MADLPVLAAAEQRVLGALLEKQVTVPASYPLSLNSLRLACNQTSSRDPIVDYDDKTVEDTVRALKTRELIRVIWAGKGSRTLKYHQLLDEALGLQPDERALIAVLLLRGAQAPGELKTRTERLYPFADRAEVETCLRRMAALPTPLVRELERRSGQQDARWIHLLGPVATPTGTSTPAPPTIDREAVLARGAADRDARLKAAYDSVAEAYAEDRSGSLVDTPFDWWLLGRVAELAGTGPVADIGCGAGHVAAYLADAGTRVVGFDVSEGLLAQARAWYPDLPFEVADYRMLLRPKDARGWAVVVGWDAFGHLAPSELPSVFAGVARVLDVGGWFVFTVDVGEAVTHRDEWFGEAVDLDVVRHDPRAVLAALRAAGFDVAEWYLAGATTDGTSTDVADRLAVLARPAT